VTFAVVNDTEQAINLSIKLISCIVSIYKKHCKMVNTTKEFQAAAEFIHEDEFYRAFVTDTSQLHSVCHLIDISLFGNKLIQFFVGDSNRHDRAPKDCILCKYLPLVIVAQLRGNGFHSRQQFQQNIARQISRIPNRYHLTY
jgi:hypothetical protein